MDPWLREDGLVEGELVGDELLEGFLWVQDHLLWTRGFLKTGLWEAGFWEASFWEEDHQQRWGNNWKMQMHQPPFEGDWLA